ncbi:MAG: gliding motility-associated ABC transporter ATP-binding subunit GldA [Saprospiraceae bacterium]|nr:gliding motility-associated ABC transporter ATP-binding subunit GldA [Saprospiraceae bacterium]
MSVEVTHLTKIYGTQKALDDVTFSARRGEILGFLGPNGAGKTTTMKIITSYLEPDDGKATVCGIDVAEHPLEVRRKVGYLPEHNSLYYDMYVREFLGFVAGIHGITDKRTAVSQMIEQTGLENESHKKIGMLSKGYKQRVGLAQALIHDPEVLVLDEPTSGLDPNQLLEIRRLIKELGTAKTVIFSTHIMQEVQALCDRVVIIDNGKIVADKSIKDIDSLIKGERRLMIELSSPLPQEVFLKIDGVTGIVKDTPTEWSIYHDDKKDIRADVFKTVVEQKGVILGMERTRSSVEDVFQTVTKK